jgi:hypothetical protein
LTATEEGEQLTDVDVERVVTFRAKFPLLPALLVSPLNAAVISWMPESTLPGVYETEQLIPEVMVHVSLENAPVESVEKVIVSLTMEPKAPETDAVQVVGLPMLTVDGTHVTFVEVVV